MKTQLIHTFDDIVSIENLLEAWQEFIKGKRHKLDVQEFSMVLMDNIFSLNNDLKNKAYRHGEYYAFSINDPKPRSIHKADVRDRLLHHAIHRKLYPFFEKKFIADSFSCQIGKGTHKAIQHFQAIGNKASKNNTKQCWILKCDIKKFFASIDHQILKDILKSHISDPDVLWLLDRVIDSFHLVIQTSSTGLPLGNLTSQLLVNIYMNELDQYVKHVLKIKHYIRYADDFVIFSESKTNLEILIPQIQNFLTKKLQLTLHPNKLYLKTLASGIDFLGWVHFPDHRVLRIATKRRMFKKIAETQKEETIQSYLGMLKWGNGWKLRERIETAQV